MSKLTRVEIAVVCLKEQGVGTVFGHPGGAILNIHDALYQHRDEVTRTLTPHKQGTSHAADGYARATGKVGMYLATPDPGATNPVTSIATVYMDSVPAVAITCNMTNDLLGKDSLQEIDITGVTMSITRYNFTVRDVSRLVTVTHRAFTTTRTGRPDPVLMDTIKDATAALCEHEKQVPEEIVRQSDTIIGQDMDRVVEMVRKAARPFIFVGDGAMLSDASDELRAFAHKIQAPVADNLARRGALGGAGELYTDMVGVYDIKTSNLGIIEANPLIVVGVRFSGRTIGGASKLAKNAKIPQLDIDLVEINKNIKVDANITDGAKVILRKLNARLDPANHNEWVAHIEHMKDMYPLHYGKNVLTDPFIIQTINKVMGGDAVIVTEVGQHQMQTTQCYQYRQPRTLLTSRGLGTMRYGLGAAIGTKMGRRDKTVINITGDGCSRMNVSEIVTVIRYNIPVVKVIVNNHVLGMMRQWQTLFYGKRCSQTAPDDSVDFVRVAEVTEAKAYRMTQKEELEPVLHEAASLDIPVVIDCQISCDDKVFLMVSPGTPITGAFDDMGLKIS